MSEQFVRYRGELEGMSQDGYVLLRDGVLRSLSVFKWLDEGDVVCPLSESVVEVVDSCRRCPLKGSCPAHKSA